MSDELKMERAEPCPPERWKPGRSRTYQPLLFERECSIPAPCENCGQEIDPGRVTWTWVEVGKKIRTCPECKRKIYAERTRSAIEKFKKKP
jgi:hypothetical protein